MTLEQFPKGYEPTDFETVNPWLSREEWLAENRGADSANVRILQGLLRDLLPAHFTTQRARLYIEGAAAVPKVLEVPANQIDIRMVFPREYTPKNSREYEDLRDKITGQYNLKKHSNTKAIMGKLLFKVDDPKLDYGYDVFTPISGRPISLHLPLEWVYGAEASIQDYEEFHRQNLHTYEQELESLERRTRKNPEEYEKRRRELLAEAYLVPLIPRDLPF